MISLFGLCEFGIPLNTVRDLVKKNITYNDLILYGEKFLKNVKGYNTIKIKSIIENIKKIKKEETLYALYIYDISIVNISFFIELGITLGDLRMLENFQIRTIYDIKNTNANNNKINKIKKAIILYDQDNKSNSNFKHYEDVLENIIKKKTKSEGCNLDELKDYIKFNTNYPIEFLEKDLLKLGELNKITYINNFIKFVIQEPIIFSIYKVIDRIENEIDKCIIISRLKGISLDEIGNLYNISRERVRQKFNKIFKKYFSYEVKENKYKDVFEIYSWEKDIFCDFYNEEIEVFFYLKFKFKMGDKEITNIINDIETTPEQKQVIYNRFKLIELFGKIIKTDKIQLINLLIKEFAKDKIKIEDFMYIYKEIIKEDKRLKGLEINSKMNLEGILIRNSNTLFGFSKMFKYYNFDLLDESTILKLKELISLPKGYYSTLVIFENNKNLMSEINVDNEYELHNLLKNKFQNLDYIKFGKMPTFYTYNSTRDEFILKIINELAPISINELLVKIQEAYGHKINSMQTLIMQTFPNYIQGNELIGNICTINEESFLVLKKILIEDIYLMNELETIVNNNTNEKIENIINSPTMYKFGYKIMSGYVIKYSIGNMEDYLYNRVMKNNFYDISDIKNIQIYKSIISKMECNLDIVKFSENRFITINKLNQVEITKEDLMEYQTEIIEKYDYEEFFTVRQYRIKSKENKLELYGFENVFFDSLVASSDKIKILSFDNNKLFYKSNNVISKQEFIQRIINKFRSITVIEIISYIEDIYEIEVKEWKLRDIVKNSDAYYNPILDKAFVDKNEYFEEVFKNV